MQRASVLLLECVMENPRIGKILAHGMMFLPLSFSLEDVFSILIRYDLRFIKEVSLRSRELNNYLLQGFQIPWESVGWKFMSMWKDFPHTPPF